MKSLLSSLTFFIISILALGQAPRGFNYQAVARDISGNPIANTNLPVRISIKSDSIGGTIFWQELHSDIITNSWGIINLVIGSGVRQPESTIISFNEIPWSSTPIFIKVDIDLSGWIEMGTSRLLTVPYAMVANELAGSVNKLTIEGETEDLEEALFEVKNKDGQTVFAVYNEGVRIYVDDGEVKGPKGGFAIGSFGVNKESSQDLLIVSPDSIRAYIDSDPSKGPKGGFAIGGFDNLKAGNQEYLRITSDSTRVYVNDNPGKGPKGGFAIGGFNTSKGSARKYMRVSKDSTNFFIGSIGVDSSSTFNIIGIGEDSKPYTQLSANLDTVIVTGFLDVRSDLFVDGNVTITGNVEDATITDIDGNVYKIVRIGTQLWMAENLKVTKLNDGTAIPEVTSSSTWWGLTTLAHCFYNNDESAYKDVYGAIYNQYVVRTGKLCPTGWHVPTVGQWNILQDYLGGMTVAGGKLKEIGTTHWLDPNTDATDEYEFRALPGGERILTGSYAYLASNGYFWSSSEASATVLHTRITSYNSANLTDSQAGSSTGMYVRCVKDQ